MSARAWCVGDLHVRGDRRENQRVERALLDLNAATNPGDVLVVAGDVTDSATEAQYSEALSLLQLVQRPKLLVPGNHDVEVMGLFYLPALKRRWAELAYLSHALALMDVGASRIVGVDSTLWTTDPFDLAQGRVGRSERVKVDWHLRHPAGRSVVVVMHHAIHNTQAERLKDATEVERLVWGRARWVVQAHTHRFSLEPACRWGAGTELVTLGCFRDGADPYVIDLGDKPSCDVDFR